MFARQHSKKSKNRDNSLLIRKSGNRRHSTRPQFSKRFDVMQLQRSIGNRAVGQLLNGNSGPVIQPKLTINPPGDKYEQEADRAARQVVDQASATGEQTAQRQEEEELQAKPAISTIQRQGMEEEEMQMKQADIVQRQEDEEEMQMKQADMVQRQEAEEEEMQMKTSIQRAEEPEEEEPLQAKSAKTQGNPRATPGLEASVRQARGGGHALPDNIRAPMEQAFGTDFSGVRVHTDSRSDRLNRSVQARAFTTGRDVFFRSGEYNPASRSGKELLAHELTHTIQQGTASIQRDDVTTTDISKTTDTGNKYTQELVLNKTKARIRIYLGVNWIKKGTWASDDAYEKFIRKVKTAAYSYMDNKFKVVCTPNAKGAGPKPVELPIDFIIYNFSSGYKIEAHGGTPGGRSAMAQAGGKVYEYRSATDLEEGITYAHEFGHALLGASDEYANPAVPGRVLTNDHSIMANYYTQGKAQAEFKARHFQHIATEVAKAFAGYTCSIRKM